MNIHPLKFSISHNRISKVIVLILMLFQYKVHATQFFNVAALCFEDRLDLDHDGNDLCMRISIIMDDSLPGSPITYLISPVSLGAADDIELQLAISANSSVHKDGTFTEISQNGTIYTKGEFFESCSGGFVNVGTGTDCEPHKRAVTIVNHGLTPASDSDLISTIFEVFQLKNHSQSYTISKANDGFMFILPDDNFAIVNEHAGTWYDNWNLSTADCDPSIGLGSCNYSTLATDTAAIVRTTLGSGVNKNPKVRAEYDILQSNGTTANYTAGGMPVFNGSNWQISSVTHKSKITSYFSEAQLDGLAVSHAGFVHYKHRHICEIINCGGGGSGSNVYTCAPGTAPCDYAFCGCHLNQTGCEKGDINEDQVCWWDNSAGKCYSADNVNENNGLAGLNYNTCSNDSSFGAAGEDCNKCNALNFHWIEVINPTRSGPRTGKFYGCRGPSNPVSARSCSTPICTVMGNRTGTTLCSGTTGTTGAFTVSSYTGTYGGEDINFTNAPTWTSFPNRTLPRFSNCGGDSQCETGICDSTTNACQLCTLNTDCTSASTGSTCGPSGVCQ